MQGAGQMVEKDNRMYMTIHLYCFRFFIPSFFFIGWPFLAHALQHGFFFFFVLSMGVARGQVLP